MTRPMFPIRSRRRFFFLLLLSLLLAGPLPLILRLSTAPRLWEPFLPEPEPRTKDRRVRDGLVFRKGDDERAEVVLMAETGADGGGGADVGFLRDHIDVDT